MVSIITPYTDDRTEFMEHLSYCVEAQDYPGVEWLMDGEKGTIGEKRNRLCEAAKGEYVVHFDSDDWYAPDYISRAVAHLEIVKADITGLRTAYFADLAAQKAWLYDFKGKQPYVIGSGMLYKRSVWQRKPFKHISEGEDTDFISNNGRISPHGNTELFWAKIHGNNTAGHKAVHLFEKADYTKFTKIFGI